MNIYETLPTTTLEFFRDLATVINRTGVRTPELREDLREIKMELHLRAHDIIEPAGGQFDGEEE